MNLNIPYDKKLHLAAGFLVGLVTGFVVAWLLRGLVEREARVFFAVMFSVVDAYLAGLLKEKYDAKRPTRHTVDPKDIKYTMYGGLPGGFVGGVICVLVLP
jgi:uncharacterized membrane protein YfcA